MKSTALVTLAGIAFAAGVVAGPAQACEDKENYYKRGYYAEYIDEMKQAGELGDAECLFRVGTVYRDGILAPQDLGTALAWFRHSAALGHPFAEFEIGTMYDNGFGVPQDYTEAARWYQLAANQGFAMAQHNLAVMYEDGVGVPKDKVRAGIFYELSTGKKTDTF